MRYPHVEAVKAELLVIASAPLAALSVYTTVALFLDIREVVASVGWFNWISLAILLPAICIGLLVWGIVQLKTAKRAIRELQVESEARQVLQEQRREAVLAEIFPATLSSEDTPPSPSG
jgi:hypothetical protein